VSDINQWQVNFPSFDQARQQGIIPWTEDDEVKVNPIQPTGTTWLVKVFGDKYPVTHGHLLFVPQQDSVDGITEAFREALKRGNQMIRRGDCDSYNVGLNCGASAGQTVMYPHVHLIPRRAGDCADPVGGVRAVIPGQANYRSTDYKLP